MDPVAEALEHLADGTLTRVVRERLIPPAGSEALHPVQRRAVDEAVRAVSVLDLQHAEERPLGVKRFLAQQYRNENECRDAGREADRAPHEQHDRQQCGRQRGGVGERGQPARDVERDQGDDHASRDRQWQDQIRRLLEEARVLPRAAGTRA